MKIGIMAIFIILIFASLELVQGLEKEKEGKMKELQKVLTAVVEEKDYSFGKPWQWDKNALGVIIPIINTTVVDRSYITIEEAGDKIKITDTGSINTMKIENNTDELVFSRGGTIMKGETQTRATQYGFIIEPKKQVKEEEVPMEEAPGIGERIGGGVGVPVRCVYASKGISGGANAKIQSDAFVSNRVYLSMKEGQQEVWNSIEKTSIQLNSVYSSISDVQLNVASDDLGGHYEEMNKIGEFKENVLDKIKDCPVSPNQIGVVLFSEKGVLGLEFFDHPKSWKAIHSKVLVGNIAELIKQQEEGHLWDFNAEKSISAVKDFIKNIAFDKAEKRVEGKGWGTFAINQDGVITEYTWIKDSIVHVISMKK